ncbi:MAG: LLM class flavin-dependent oxidoreductase, partial [Planctomycetaceae bacterium]|nr:LLM class flavin-dependent oxidoreductase [Planctomycetaceae bacterium]
QVELADRLGYDYIWVTEHHFQEEASHSSAPDLFLAACSQRTRRIRLGHGVVLTSPYYNNPIRLAERVATLDLLSGGRVDFGTGESGTLLEMGGFNIDINEKTEHWAEGWQQAVAMMTMSPYPGHTGKYTTMPVRNVVPKPYQKPHPPLWYGCSRRESVIRAAKLGMGAMVFGFVEPEQAEKWIKEYYDIIKSDECVPVGHTVNANIHCVIGMSVHQDSAEAQRRCEDGFKFFGYGAGHYYSFGAHRPGREDIWAEFEQVKHEIPDNAGKGAIGTPAEVREHIRGYAEIGLDQLVFMTNAGKMEHRHVCDTLELFADEVMPEFKVGEADRVRKKNEELAPYIEAALKRRKPIPEVAEEDIPLIKSTGLLIKEKGGTESDGRHDPTRGGAFPKVADDLLKQKKTG